MCTCGCESVYGCVGGDTYSPSTPCKIEWHFTYWLPFRNIMNLNGHNSIVMSLVHFFFCMEFYKRPQILILMVCGDNVVDAHPNILSGALQNPNIDFTWFSTGVGPRTRPELHQMHKCWHNWWPAGAFLLILFSLGSCSLEGGLCSHRTFQLHAIYSMCSSLVWTGELQRVSPSYGFVSFPSFCSKSLDNTG